LQLDIFAAPPDPPPQLPFFQGIFEANQRNLRAGMLSRLSDELESRVAKGSEILIALEEGDTGDVPAAPGLVDSSGQYVEPGAPCARARERAAPLPPPPRPRRL
jgi:hypothetical protein